MSPLTLFLVGFAAGVALGLVVVVIVSLARISRLADDALEAMERPVFIGSGFLDVGAVFEWPERDA